MGNYFENVFNSNGFDILVKENKLRSEYLSVEDKNIIKNVVSRLSASKLSAFDIQISRKDFIGMALEAEQRGETLSSVIGSDMNSFCSEIIKNGRKKDWRETLILAIHSVLYNLILIYGIYYVILNSCSASVKITLSDIFAISFWCLIGIPLGNYLSGKTTFESKFKKNISFFIFLAYIGFSIFSDNAFHPKQIILFEVVGWVPLVVIFILLMMFYFIRNNYFSSLAKEYNWRDS